MYIGNKVWIIATAIAKAATTTKIAMPNSKNQLIFFFLHFRSTSIRVQTTSDVTTTTTFPLKLLQQQQQQQQHLMVEQVKVNREMSCLNNKINNNNNVSIKSDVVAKRKTTALSTKTTTSRQRRQQGVIFINILCSTFPYISVSQSFSLITIWLHNFLV